MFGKAAPKKCLPRTTKRYQKITRTYRKSVERGAAVYFSIGNFWYITTIVFTVYSVPKIASKSKYPKSSTIKARYFFGSCLKFRGCRIFLLSFGSSCWSLPEAGESLQCWVISEGIAF